MTENTDDYIKTEIRGRNVVYYLTTEDDLRNIKNKNLFADFALILTSLSASVVISTGLTKITSLQLPQEVINYINMLFIIFIVITILLFSFAVYMYIEFYSLINKIIDSGTVRSVNIRTDEYLESNGKISAKKDTNKLEIIEAKYWTKNKSIDVTQELKNMIVENKLDVIVSNDIKPPDPDIGTRKKLTVKYIFDGNEVVKEFLEKQRMILP